ncbi:L,D-transpeptidase, partial [Paenibacillus cellulositrophicus]|uniref:L,D-transpeptidase n=1 Tax=Paenibacillus cellulositrophicus TaxID=562959 RepID=UPI003F7EE752
MSIEVYPSDHRLVVRSKDQTIKEYTVAFGNPTTPTPIGEYQIVYKGKNWGAAFGPRWLGLNVPWGTYGIHGTNNPYSITRSPTLKSVRIIALSLLPPAFRTSRKSAFCSFHIRG